MRPDIYTRALSYISVPYRHQGRSAETGCDCLGFLILTLEGLVDIPSSLELPSYSPSWIEHRKDDPLIEGIAVYLPLRNIRQLEIGDILIFRMRKDMPAKHCAFLGRDKIVHCRSDVGVVEEEFTREWQRRLSAAFYVPEP
jgi:NlpC/P60 family putative phage cell wall peptidase